MATPEQTKQYSKNWRDKNLNQGLCSQCGKEPLLSTLYGLKCLRRFRDYTKKTKGYVGWEVSRQGTVPYEHRKGPITFPKKFVRGLQLVKVNRDGLTAYYETIRPNSRLKGAWITIKIEKRGVFKYTRKTKEKA